MPQVWLGFVQDDTPIILDLSDIAKPLAKKMDYPAIVRDGSTGVLVNGYWLVELYSSFSRKNPVPVLLEPFSHEEPSSPGQNPVVLAAVHKIFELTDKRGVLVIDRGFNGWVMFEYWLDNKYRFVARHVGKRHLLRYFGDSEQSEAGQLVPIRAQQPAEQTPTGHRFNKLIKRRGKPAIRITYQVNLEKIRTFRWCAIHRIILLGMLVMIYFGWFLEAHPNICERLVSLSQPLPDNPDFLSYRLLGGLTETINTCFWLHRDLLRRSLS